LYDRYDRDIISAREWEGWETDGRGRKASLSEVGIAWRLERPAAVKSIQEPGMI